MPWKQRCKVQIHGPGPGRNAGPTVFFCFPLYEATKLIRAQKKQLHSSKHGLPGIGKEYWEGWLGRGRLMADFFGN